MRRSATAALVLAGVLAAGCAGIPQSGPIRLGHAPPAANGAGFDNIPVLPPGPQTGSSPVALVSGFLTAMGDSADRYGVAREFLAPGTSWDSASEITVYNAPPAVHRTGRGRVTVTAQQVGVISPRGSFQARLGRISLELTLVRRAGQWRIDRLPDGVLLSTDEAERSLQPLSIYFLNRTEDRVVPDPVLVAVQQPGLATSLIDDLLTGPSPALAPAVTSAVPQGTALIGTVPIDGNGVAEVNLSSQARDLDPAQLEALAAQIVWTLRQLSAVSAVRLLANSTPLTSPDVPTVLNTRSWRRFDPSAPPASPGVLFTRSGLAAAIGTVVPEALAHRSISFPARSADGSQVAALGARDTSLLIGGATGPLQQRLSAAHLSPPAFDPAGNVYVGEAGPLGAHLIEIPARDPGHPLVVTGPSAARPIDAVAVSRDGSRIALVVGRPGHAALEIGTLAAPPGHPAVHALVTVIPAGHDVRGAAWLAANQLVTTERSGPGHRSVVEVGVDGYQVDTLTAAGAPPAPIEVAAAPGQRILIAAAGGIWALNGNGWVRRATGTAPSYAG